MPGVFRNLAAAFAAFGIASCATAPDPVTRGEQLIAQLKAASGGGRLDDVTTFHSTGTRVRNGTVDGVYESWGDFRTMRYAIVETFAGVTTAGGFDGEQGWSLGADGKVRTTARADSRPGDKLNVYLNTQAYFWPDRFPASFVYRGREAADGRFFDAVTVTPEGGLPVDFWLDPDTHRLARIRGSNGGATFDGVVKAYQEFDGLWIISEIAQTMHAGAMTQTETARVTSFSFEPVPAERFAPPRSPAE